LELYSFVVESLTWPHWLYDKWIQLLKVSFPKQGTTTQNTAHSVNDLDTPIHTGTQLEKSSPSPKSSKIRVIYNQQYKMVHNDTSDLHQHSVNSEWCHNSQHTPPRGQPSHTNAGPTKPCTDTACDKQDRIKNNWIRHLAANTVPELLMMSEWRSKHVEFYHQIKSIKSCISLVFIWSLCSNNINISTGFAALETLDVDDINRAWEYIKESIKTSAKEHKPWCIKHQHMHFFIQHYISLACWFH